MRCYWHNRECAKGCPGAEMNECPYDPYAGNLDVLDNDVPIMSLDADDSADDEAKYVRNAVLALEG